MCGDPLIYPDLVVHVRGPGPNYLAVEFKKEEESRKRPGNYKDAAKWDVAKLQYLSCRERMTGVSPYEETVFVILKPNEADFILPDQFPAEEGIGNRQRMCVGEVGGKVMMRKIGVCRQRIADAVNSLKAEGKIEVVEERVKRHNRDWLVFYYRVKKV